MPASKVRLFSDPVLKKRCENLDLNDKEYLDVLLPTMHETMVAENGIGLAANQIGESVRAFILKDGESYKEYLNPEITSQSDLVDFEGEGCLSIPGASATTKRFKSVTMTWFDKNGIKAEGSFEDMKAFAVQHEMDHLNGKLYVDQFGPLKRDLVLTKHRKFLKGV